MSRWIVVNLPSWLLLAGLIVVVVGGTAAVQAFVRHRFPRLKQGGQNEVAQFVFPVIAVVYGFLIGFIVLALWGQVNSADQTTRAEGAGAVQMAELRDVFGKAESARIRQSLLEYGRAAAASGPVPRPASPRPRPRTRWTACTARTRTSRPATTPNEPSSPARSRRCGT